MPQSLFPVVRYDDPRAAIDFLEQAFGFERRAVHEDDGGTIQHAELVFGDSLLMLGPVAPDRAPARGGAALYVVVGDPDAHCAQARAAGAQITMELSDQDYGSRDYAAVDPEGNAWSFGTYDPSTVG